MYSHAPTGRKSSGGRPPVAHAGRAHEATEPQRPLNSTLSGRVGGSRACKSRQALAAGGLCCRSPLSREEEIAVRHGGGRIDR